MTNPISCHQADQVAIQKKLSSLVSHMEPTFILSAIDDPGKPTPDLLNLAIRVITAASQIDLQTISARLPHAPHYTDVWPGEHYKLLAAFMQVLRPKNVLEIGTSTGISALTMKHFLPEGSRITTFDIFPWTAIPDHVLNEADFNNGKLIQIVENLTFMHVALEHKALIQNADFIFMDASKDVECEIHILENFKAIGLKEGALLLFDDIRVLNMLEIWRRIRMPKLDLTSFGHWSGTGLVKWTNS